MKKSKNELTEEIKTDKELRPYFIDYLGENLKMTFGQTLDLDGSQRERFTDCANSKLAALLWMLEARVPKRHIDFVLHEVCRYYATMSIISKDQGSSAQPAFTFLRS